MTRWHRMSRREPTEAEVMRSQGMMIVCSSQFDVVVMPVQMTPIKLKDGSVKSFPTFSMPWGARWSGDVMWWREMPDVPGAWKRWLKWSYWMFQFDQLRKWLQR